MPRKPWITSLIIEYIKILVNLYNEFRKTKDVQSEEQYKIRNRVIAIVKEAKNSYYCNSINDPRKTWSKIGRQLV